MYGTFPGGIVDPVSIAVSGSIEWRTEEAKVFPLDTYNQRTEACTEPPEPDGGRMHVIL